MNFTLEHTDPKSNARAGIITTGHGRIETPIFMPVGTAGTVKGIAPWMLPDTGAQIILGNTFWWAESSLSYAKDGKTAWLSLEAVDKPAGTWKTKQCTDLISINESVSKVAKTGRTHQLY